MRREVFLLIVLLVTAVTAQASSVPLHPRTAEKMKEYERINDWVRLTRDAASRGMGSFPIRGPVITPERPTATLRILALLVSFSDRRPLGTQSKETYRETLFKLSSKKSPSVAGFFALNSNEALTVNGDVFGWYSLPETEAEYAADLAGLGEYPRNAQKLIEDAVAQASGVPFAEFDAFSQNSKGGDGTVDVLLVIHSGLGAEVSGEPDNLLSHAGTLSKPIQVGGVRVEHYVLGSIDAHVGVFCYGVARILGAPALHDTEYRWSGLGTWSSMAYGIWGGLGGSMSALLDAYSRVHLGFVTPTDVTGDMAAVRLGCGNKPPPVFRLYPGGVPGPEYFLVECRKRGRFDANLPGEGVLIYHVDERVPDNEYPSCGPGALHPRVAVEQADGQCELEAGRKAEANDLWARFGGTKVWAVDFDDASLSKSRDYEGQPTGIAVRNFQVLDKDILADMSVSGGVDSTPAAGLSVVVEDVEGRLEVAIEVLAPRSGWLTLQVTDSAGAVVWDQQRFVNRLARNPFRWVPEEGQGESRALYFIKVRVEDWWEIQRLVMP